MNTLLRHSCKATIITLCIVVGMFLVPRPMNAQVTGLLTDAGSCIASGYVNDLYGDLLSGLGSLVGTDVSELLGFGSISGGGGGGGNEVPVNDAESIGVQENQLEVQEGELENLSWLVLKERDLDCLLFVATQAILEEITGSTIGWVNTGFAGDPFYLSDPDAFFASLEDQVTLSYFENKLTSAPIPSNYRNTVLNTLARSRTRVTLDELLDCPLGNKIDNLFTEASPSVGWDNFLTVMTNPACTPQGSYAIAHNELSREIASVKFDLDKLTVDGFLPKLEDGQVATPATVIQSQINSIVDSGLTELENADELSEIIGILGNLVSNILSDNSSLRNVSATDFSGDIVLDFPETPPPAPGGGGGGTPDETPIDLANEMQNIIGNMNRTISTDTAMSSWRKDLVRQEFAGGIQDGIGNVEWALNQVPLNETVLTSGLNLIQGGINDVRNLYIDASGGVTPANRIQLEALYSDLMV